MIALLICLLYSFLAYYYNIKINMKNIYVLAGLLIITGLFSIINFAGGAVDLQQVLFMRDANVTFAQNI